MTTATLQTIMERMKVATPESPLAVFRVGSSGMEYDCCFGATIAAQKRIKDSKSFIMLVHRDRSKEGVRRILLDARGRSR